MKKILKDNGMQRELVTKITELYSFDKNISKTYKETASLLLYAFGIEGLSDPMYICNVIANCCGAEDNISHENAEKIAEHLVGTKHSAGAYASSIPKSAKNIIVGILEKGGNIDMYLIRAAISNTRTFIKVHIKRDTCNEFLEHETKREKLLAERQAELTAWLAQKRKADRELEREWVEEHVVNVNIYINNKNSLAYDGYRLAIEPTRHALYNTVIAQKESSDGTMVKLTAVIDMDKRPCVLISVEDEHDVLLTSFNPLTQSFYALDFEIGNKLYYINIERNTTENMAYNAERRRNASIRKQLAYPNNLISDIMDKTWTEEIPDDLCKRLENAIHLLPENQQETLRLWYQERTSFQNIAKHLNLSSERARQIKAKALRRLRMSRVRPDTILYEELEEKMTGETLNITRTAIESCHFSTRLYNCLKRSGVNTIEELSTYTRDEVAEFRNLGTSCMQELQSYLKGHGMKLRDEDTASAANDSSLSDGNQKTNVLTTTAKKVGEDRL